MHDPMIPGERAPDLAADTLRLRRAFAVALGFVFLLWMLKLTEIWCGLNFARYGVFPRSLEGLWGILLGPLIHGSVSHLFANTAPLIVLGTALLYGYPRAARILLPLLYLGSGLGVWVFARPAHHIGASGLTFGMMFFVFTVGVLRWDKRAIALALVVFLLYGGMIWGIFPRDPGISFESHFFGAAIGVGLAFLLRNLDPPPPEKHYSWEGEEQEDPETDDANVAARDRPGEPPSALQSGSSAAPADASSRRENKHQAREWPVANG